MVLMLVSVVFLGLEGASVGSTSGESQMTLDVSNLQNKDKLQNALIALLCGLICPVFYTIKAFLIRQYS
jgi:drug/metabolite transporter (DMT)-like permease